MSILAGFSQMAQHLVGRYGTGGVLVGMTLESAGIPIPSEVIMPLGALGARGPGALAVVIVAGTIGNVLGSWVAYAIGAALGGQWRGGWLLHRRHWERAHRWFLRYGDRAVLFGRLLPVVRTYISFPAGAAGMPAVRFTAYTALGSAIWSAALAIAGYQLGNNWDRLGPWLHRYAAVALLGVVVAAVVWWRRARRA